MQNGTRIFLGGAPEGYDARLVAKELDRGAPVIHVARDDKRLEAMRTALAVMAPRAVVLELPAWDCLPYDRVSPNPEISRGGWRRSPPWRTGCRGPSSC